MELLLKNNTNHFLKKIAQKDISTNKIKKICSMVTIALVTMLLMSLALFASGYEITKDRLAAKQPQVIFYDLTLNQVQLIKSTKNIDSIKEYKSNNGTEIQATLKNATQMTKKEFITIINSIISMYNIKKYKQNDFFIDSLPDGGLLNQKNIIFLVVCFSIIFIGVLVIYNIFYLSIVNQVQQYGQLRTIGMTKKQIEKMIHFEQNYLCFWGIITGLFFGSILGYLLQPNGWEWKQTLLRAAVISIIIIISVHLALSKPIKIATSIPPVASTLFRPNCQNKISSKKLKRNLSIIGLAFINVFSNKKKNILSVISLSLSGMLFMLASTFITSIDPESIVKKELFQYGQFIINNDTTNRTSEKETNILTNQIEKISFVNNITKIKEPQIKWTSSNISHEDEISIINEKEYNNINQFIDMGIVNYQELVNNNKIIANSDLEDVGIGDIIEVKYNEETNIKYSIGAIINSEVYTDTSLFGGAFVIPEELLPKNLSNLNIPTELIVSCNKKDYSIVESELNSLLEKNTNWKMSTIKMAIYQKKETIKKVSYPIIGLTIFFLIFSLMTFISTIITNIANENKNYMLLHSLGLPFKKIINMVIWENLLLSTIILLVTFTISFSLGYFLMYFMFNFGFFYLSFKFPLLIFIYYCFFIIFFIFLLTIASFKTIRKM